MDEQVAKMRAKVTRTQTCLSLAQRDVRQQVMASDDAEQLKNMPEVCLITSPLTLQREQEIPAASYPSSLVLVNNVHKKEGQHTHITVRQLCAHNIKHAVKGVKPIRVVHSLLRPRLHPARRRSPRRGGITAGRRSQSA